MGLGGAPVVVIDGNVAFVVAPVTNSGSRSVVRGVADSGPDADNEFQRRVQHEAFPIDADLDIIAAHGPLDVRAASIDWDDGSVILRRSDTGMVTVADARAEAATWSRESWHWLADEVHTFTGLYLRGRHPELVREYPRSEANR